MKETVKSVTRHKGHVISKVHEGNYWIYTDEEWAYGPGLRYPAWSTCSLEEAIEWIG